MTAPGKIVVLNGAPRSGKTSVAEALQEAADVPWLALGVDAAMPTLPARLRPGLGLRPGGERPDLEPYLPALATGLYAAVAAHSRAGLCVVVDIGHHDSYTRPLGTLAIAARLLRGLPSYLVGVRCPVEEILRRRSQAPVGRYVTSGEDGGVPEPIRRWQEAVHDPGIYDLEVATAVASPQQCAAAVLARVARGPGQALAALDVRSRRPG